MFNHNQDPYSVLGISPAANDQEIVDAYFRHKEFVERTYDHKDQLYIDNFNAGSFAFLQLRPFGCSGELEYKLLCQKAREMGDPKLIWNNARYVFTPEEAERREQVYNEQRLENMFAEAAGKRKAKRIVAFVIIAIIVAVILFWNPITQFFHAVSTVVGCAIAACILLPLVAIMSKAI